MLNTPTTKEEAEKYKYGHWGGLPEGRPYVAGDCAYEAYGDGMFYQCSRKHGHGPNKLYCKQHAKMISKRS